MKRKLMTAGVAVMGLVLAWAICSGQVTRTFDLDYLSDIYGVLYGMYANDNATQDNVTALGDKIDSCNTTMVSVGGKVDSCNTTLVANGNKIDNGTTVLGGKIDSCNTTLVSNGTKLDAISDKITARLPLLHISSVATLVVTDNDTAVQLGNSACKLMWIGASITSAGAATGSSYVLIGKDNDTCNIPLSPENFEGGEFPATNTNQYYVKLAGDNTSDNVTIWYAWFSE